MFLPQRLVSARPDDTGKPSLLPEANWWPHTSLLKTPGLARMAWHDVMSEPVRFAPNPLASEDDQCRYFEVSFSERVALGKKVFTSGFTQIFTFFGIDQADAQTYSSNDSCFLEISLTTEKGREFFTLVKKSRQDYQAAYLLAKSLAIPAVCTGEWRHRTRHSISLAFKHLQYNGKDFYAATNAPLFDEVNIDLIRQFMSQHRIPIIIGEMKTKDLQALIDPKKRPLCEGEAALTFTGKPAALIQLQTVLGNFLNAMTTINDEHAGYAESNPLPGRRTKTESHHPVQR